MWGRDIDMKDKDGCGEEHRDKSPRLCSWKEIE
jgi:hypothetical protein